MGVAGAGFSGAVIARELAEAGHDVVVFETRDHVAGNCHTERDLSTQVMVHRYGPHIFHTADERVWSYVNRFGDDDALQPPRPDDGAGPGVPAPGQPADDQPALRDDVLGPTRRGRSSREQADSSIIEPRNFEEQALKFMGPRLYEAFFLGYTRKQWGLSPTEIPASVLKRLPLRFSYEDSYFNHPHQAIPRDGYTALVAAILDHPRIEVRLSTAYGEADRRDFDHSVWSGPLDAWFDHRLGRLGYRTLDFEEIRTAGDHLGCAVMNYGDLEVPYTRIAEHKHFAPWEEHEATVCFRETSRLAADGDIPYYPIRLAEDKGMLRQYVDAARNETGVTFVGRLGTYRYLDMDVTIAEALAAADGILDAVEHQAAIRPLFVDA